jgi:hypothetical protein
LADTGGASDVGYVQVSRLLELRERSERVDRLVQAFVRWDDHLDELDRVLNRLTRVRSARQDAAVRSALDEIRLPLRKASAAADDDALEVASTVADFRESHKRAVELAGDLGASDLKQLVATLLVHVNDLIDRAYLVRQHCKDEAIGGIGFMCTEIGIVLALLQEGTRRPERELDRPAGTEKVFDPSRQAVGSHNLKYAPGGRADEWSATAMKGAPRRGDQADDQ